ncbi:hypothetical protein [Streptacidiphilus rugosus]|uniref:hypothetical protein n=1 Tax=Streptacidiphilus rugosus TaxID=405783 RepID=UPI00056AFD19|nr:hypothetical protein [Streptacidiphilus rugosus]
MPSGRYSFHDTHDDTPLGEERFSCAAGPSGWRYTSQTFAPDGRADGAVDLTLDSRFRPVRLELRREGWQVRGGTLAGLTWVRTHVEDVDLSHTREGQEKAHAFAGRSPAFLVATARMLALSEGASTRVRVVSFTEPVLAPRTLDQGWTLEGIETHPTDSGPLTVRRFRVADLETGEEGLVHLAGDVVLSAPGVELEDLETPPGPWI